jgi:hypothetical protein
MKLMYNTNIPQGGASSSKRLRMERAMPKGSNHKMKQQDEDDDIQSPDSSSDEDFKFS